MAHKPKLYHAGTLTYTRVQLALLLFWLLWGDFCYILMESIVPSILPLKFKSLGASNTAIALIMTTIPMTINTVLNPVISFKSDRYRSRWGRRIPFILFTLPFLVLFLLGLGFGDKIGYWLYPHLQKMVTGLTPSQTAIGVIGFMMILFSFFNTFVNSVFWYLFNDVVPEHMLARFMSWLRTVTTISGSFYSFFIFKHAQTHTTEIFIGAAILYVFGFGMMCLNVREGNYPPPPRMVDGGIGVRSAVKTFGKECHALTHYWYVFLISMCWAAGSGAVGPFSLYFSQAIGLDLEMIGRISGVANLVMAVAILVSGWLADRYHPIRIVLVGMIFQVFLVVPLQMIWLFWQPTPQTAFYVSMAMTVGLGIPAGALIGVLDPPLFMCVFPRQRYGQFCSANAMWRSLTLIVSGAGIGLFFDLLLRYMDHRTAYCLLPCWQWFFMALMLFFLTRLYASWKRYGGDKEYVPPMYESPIIAQCETGTHPSAVPYTASGNKT